MSAEFVQGIRVEGSNKSWHGLENTISLEDAQDMNKVLKGCGVSTVYSLPVMGIRFDDDGKILEALPTDQLAIYDENNVHLGTHGAETYNIHQVSDVLRPMFDIIETMDGKFRFDFGCRLRAGRVVTFNFVQTDETTILGEPHKAYLNVSTSFDGTLPTKAGGTSVREVCMNTVALSNSLVTTKKINIRHRRELPSSDNLRLQVEEVLKQFEGYKELAEMFAKFRISKDAAKDWLTKQLFVAKLEEKKTDTGEIVKVLSEPSTRMSNRIDSLIKSYETTLEELGGESTAWTLWNALTRFSDHESGVRMTEDRKSLGVTEELVRYENNLFGASAAFKEREAEQLKMLIAA